MTESGSGSDPPSLQSKKVAALTAAQIAAIDDALFAKTERYFRKVAFVVGSMMSDSSGQVAGIPDVFYAQRVRGLVEDGVLEHQGSLDRMRWCEVRRISKSNG